MVGVFYVIRAVYWKFWAQVGGVLEILGPGGRHIGNFGPGWAEYWKFWAQVGRVLGILGPGGLHDF